MGSAVPERRVVFGEDAVRYDRFRPSYPAALIDDLVTWVSAHARVVDVGCGTAKGTRLLAAAGMTGVGVEAHPAMAQLARGHLAPYPGWRVDVSDFETWAPQDGDTPVDLVASAQAWHWVDPAAGFERVREVLRPGGWITLWWNLAREDPSDLGQRITAVYEEHAPGEPFCPRLGDEGCPFDAAPADLRLDEPVTRLYPWQRLFTTAELIEHQRTHSNHAVMDSCQREHLLTALAEVIDRAGGTYEYPYICRLWAAQRQA
jgi:SAM-dependent methyltransferase